jgi:hypothetical protein
MSGRDLRKFFEIMEISVLKIYQNVIIIQVLLVQIVLIMEAEIFHLEIIVC